jgi:hypothetical protein
MSLMPCLSQIEILRARCKVAATLAVVAQQAEPILAVAGAAIGRQRFLNRRVEGLAIGRERQALERPVPSRFAVWRDEESLRRRQLRQEPTVERKPPDGRLGLGGDEQRAIGQERQALAIEIVAGVGRAAGIAQGRDGSDLRRAELSASKRET